MKKSVSRMVVAVLVICVFGACGKDTQDLDKDDEFQAVTEGISESVEAGDVTKEETEQTRIEAGVIARMYITALDNLVEMDPALNDDMAYIAIDCESLPDVDATDIEAILAYFSEKYDVDTMDKSVMECYEEGLGNEEDLSLYGIVLYVEQVGYIKDKKAALDCVKYRSGLGAIGVTVKLKYKNGWLIEDSSMTWIS